MHACIDAKYHPTCDRRDFTLPPISRAQIAFVLKAAAAGFLVALVYTAIGAGWLKPGTRVEIVRATNPAERTTDSAPTGHLSYAAAVAAAAPAVVNIYTATQVSRGPAIDSPLFQQLFGDRSGLGTQPNLNTGAGSGVILSRDGFIVTNHHLIADTDEINVMLRNDDHYRARVVGTDPDTDLAILKIDAQDLPTITLAASGTLRVGDVVLAIGNPLGAGQTVTMGIVSATGRSHLGLNTFEDFIQTDAAINPGNSGGALINPAGELVGVNTAIFTQNDGGASGLGLAIPVRLVQTVAEQIIRHGRVIRGWLGVVARDLSPALRRELGLPQEGVVVTGVVADGPAEAAGIRAGDVITDVDGNRIVDAQALLAITTMAAPGSEVLVRGLRDGEAFETRAHLVQRPLPGS